MPDGMQELINTIVAELGKQDTFQAAREVMTTVCHKRRVASCPSCMRSDGCIPHDISTWPDGAVRGMLEEAIDKMGIPYPVPYDCDPTLEALAQAFLGGLRGGDSHV